MSDSVTAQEVLGHLVDVDYPADKYALVAAAEAHGASTEVVRALRAIPPSVGYRNDDEVVRSLRLDPAPGRDAGTAAQQARYDSKRASPRPLATPSRTVSWARTGAPSDRHTATARR